MSTLTRNLASSAIERAISAVLTLLIVPVQVRLLGVEAYGLLGFIAALQVVFNILDFGLGPTVIREVAADTDDSRIHSRSFIQALSGVYWSLAVLAGLALMLGAPWLAQHWLQLGRLPVDIATLAIWLIAISVVLRWPVALYSGALAGAQRLDVVNSIRIFVTIIKLLGGLMVLVYFRTLHTYLLFLAVAALVELLSYMWMTVRILPGLSLRPAFEWTALQSVWRFSLHMNLISVLTVIFVQSDRLLIGRLLPIENLGFYAIAYSLVSALSVVQSIVSTALFPALAQQVVDASAADVRKQCAVATELLMYVVSGLGCALIFFGGDVLTIWISAETALRAAAPTAILAFGFIASAASSVPYTLAIASGCTAIPLAVNLAAVVVYFPALYWLIRHSGIEGAAWAWAGLNIYYLIVMLPLLQRRIPMARVPVWFARHVFPFFAAAMLIMGICGAAAARFGSLGARPWAAWLALGGVAYGAVAFWFLDKSVLQRLKAWRHGQSALDVPAA